MICGRRYYPLEEQGNEMGDLGKCGGGPDGLCLADQLRRISPGDNMALENGFNVYEALYAQRDSETRV
jgi:hypothetical protein